MAIMIENSNVLLGHIAVFVKFAFVKYGSRFLLSL